MNKPLLRQCSKAGLPEIAARQLAELYHNDTDTTEIVRDPIVSGAFAVRLTKMDGRTVDLLWTATSKEWDECEFESWPPVASNNNLFKNCFM